MDRKPVIEHRMKPGMTDLYIRHRLTPSLVDVEANVPAETTYNMIQWIPVSRVHAEQVLRYLSEKYQRTYTLETIEVVLLREKEDHLF